MIFAIVSDIHSNIEALNAVLDKCKKLKIKKYLCLGDIVGYNANPVECIDKIRSLDSVNIIKGNHDEYVGKDISVEGTSKLAGESVLWTRSVLNKDDRKWLADLPIKFTNTKEGFSAIHATLDLPESWEYILDIYDSINSFNSQTTQVCFFGHTHLPKIFVKESVTPGMRCRVRRVSEWEKFPPNDEEIIYKLEKGKKYLINVGSVGQPRDGDTRASFAVYDSKQKLMKRYAISYDVGLAQRKILAAGLPAQLAYRLSLGQ